MRIFRDAYIPATQDNPRRIETVLMTIIFWDIASTVGPWSPNTWKVRYALVPQRSRSLAATHPRQILSESQKDPVQNRMD